MTDTVTIEFPRQKAEELMNDLETIRRYIPPPGSSQPRGSPCATILAHVSYLTGRLKNALARDPPANREDSTDESESYDDTVDCLGNFILPHGRVRQVRESGLTTSAGSGLPALDILLHGPGEHLEES